MKPFAPIAAALCLIAAPAAFASHVKVVTALPAAGARVAAPKQIRLQMSDTLSARASGASLVMTAMPGMADHPPMKMAAQTSIAPDGKTLIVTPSKKLPVGTYRVDWHAVSGDSHRVTGQHHFSVK